MAKGKILLHPVVDLKRKISKFKESLEFVDFIDALEFALENNLEEDINLTEAWPIDDKLIKSQKPLSEFCKLLPKIDIYCPSPSQIVETEEKKPSLTESSGQNIKDQISEMFSQMEEREALYGDKYGWFQPSLILADALSSAYSDDLNPGTIIASYLHLLFTGSSLFRVGNGMNRVFLPPWRFCCI